MGHPKNHDNIVNDLSHAPLQEPADDKFVWTYVSQEFSMTQVNIVSEDNICPYPWRSMGMLMHCCNFLLLNVFIMDGGMG